MLFINHLDGNLKCSLFNSILKFSVISLVLNFLLFSNRLKANGIDEWDIDLNKSQLMVSVKADGTPFETIFTRMEGRIILDKNNLQNSIIDVLVPVESLETGNKDGDELALSEDFFNQVKWPHAKFTSHLIEKDKLNVEHYWVSGKLQIKGHTQKIRVPVLFKNNGKTAMLSGKSILQRLDFSLGTGEWTNTQWLSNNVEVTFSLSLKIKK